MVHQGNVKCIVSTEFHFTLPPPAVAKELESGTTELSTSMPDDSLPVEIEQKEK